MKYSAVLAATVLSLALNPCAFSATPSEVIALAAESEGGMQAFHALGVLQMEISQIDTFADGSQKDLAFTAYLDTNLLNSRVELPGEVVSVRNGDTGWAMIQGQPDIRQQTPRIAPGANRELLMPLLFPFSLFLDGVVLEDSVDEVVFAKKPALRLAFSVPEMFFASPFMGLEWDVLVGAEDNRFVAARFLPVEGYDEAKNEGLQIQVTETVKINGVSLPSQVTLKGIASNGQPTGMERVVTIKTTVLLGPNPALFIRPDKLEAIEEG